MRIPRLAYLYPTALGYVLWLFTGGLFNSKSRYRIFQLARETPAFLSPFPKVSIMELMGNARELTLLEPKAAEGNVTLPELTALACLAEECQAQNVFEFGTFDGRTALNLIAHSPPNAHLYTLDLPADQLGQTHFSIMPGERNFVEKTSSGLRFQDTPQTDRITQLLGDSATFDFSPYLGKMDLIFIDASHAYDYVKSDTQNALKLLRAEGGLLIWHDYDTPDWPGVTRALHEFYRGDKRFKGLTAIRDTRLAMLRVGAS